MNENILRKDGRFAEELRKIQIDHFIVENRNYLTFSQGLTQVRTCIFQNKEKGQIGVNLNFSDLARNEPINDRKLYEMKNKIYSIFSNVVSSDYQIDINIEVLQDNGSLMSVIINSITLCLCYSGINIKDMILSLTCNDLMDLTTDEEKQYFAIVVMSANYNQILNFQLSGKCQRIDVKNALNNATRGIEKVNFEIRKYLSNVVNK